jgi:GntR family transcriptional regulator
MVLSRLNTENDPMPIYFKVQKALKEQIESKRFAPGESIPSERILAEQYQVSLGTVKKAIGNLVADGYLYRIKGKGTFVTNNTIRRENIKSYRLLKDFKGRESSLKLNLLSLTKARSDSRINKLLKIRPDDELYKVERTFTSKGRALIYTVSHLPQKLFPELGQKGKFSLGKNSLYVFVEKEYAMATIGNEELFYATAAPAKAAEVLGINEGDPLLVWDMLALTYKDQPYEFRISYCVTEIRKIHRRM